MTTVFRALVVDDDVVVRKVVVRELQNLGAASVEAASGGAQALDLLRLGTKVDVVICDLHMPDGDGIEFLREFGSLSPDTALILMSSAASDILDAAASLARQRKIRLLGTVPKPVTRALLMPLLAQVGGVKPSGDIAKRAATAPIDVEEVRVGIAAGEFTVFVQPKVNLTTFELVGVEALVRWRSALRGLVFPGAFIGLCERNGLIRDLTFAMVRGSVDALDAWRAQGLDTRVAVNFDAGTLCRLDVPDQLMSLLAARGLSPKHLVVELTESAVAENLENLLDVATRLRLRGIQLSIDDFGTGYSSLAQLRSLPFTELKIDQSFVMTARKNPSSRAIVESSVGLAHKLGMKALAEGIETVEDLLLMRELGCDVGQGALIAMPFDWRELPYWEASRPRTLEGLRTPPS